MGGLLEEAMENCTMLDARTIEDGYGGVSTTYVDGATFKAAIAFDSSIEALAAQKQGVTSLYSVLTSKTVNLQYHNVFRRESDKKVFRVTSDGDDNKTPNSAMLNARKVTAEEWVLDDGQSTSNS